jgi:CheY-like chemotaxis protein
MLAYATVCLIATGLLFAAAVALVQRLAVAHGGTLRVRSDGPGKGSTFTIRLPKAPVPESAAPASGSLPTPAGVRILIIEDQQDVRDSLRMLLELDNHEVETAANGREGVAKFDAFSPSVVLVDIGIPEMNGYEVAQAIRSRKNGTRVSLIAVTGYGQPNDRRRAIAAGFDEHLTKPVGYEELRKLVIST